MAERVIDFILAVLACGAIPYAWILFYRYPRMGEFRELREAAARMHRLARLKEELKNHRRESNDILAISEGRGGSPASLPPSNGHAGV